MIDLHIFEFPLSLILAMSLVLCIIVFQNKSFTKPLTGRLFTSVMIVAASVFLAVEGTFGLGLQHHWTFIVLTVVLLLSLGYQSLLEFKTKSFCAYLSHFGLFLVLYGGMFGSPDVIDAHMKVFLDGEAEHMAVDTDGNVVPLPFSISLDEFKIDCYQDGVSPKQFTSTLTVDGKMLRTSVNHPCRYRGYRIYQSGYDPVYGEYSVLKVVRDPWLPIVAIGAVLLCISAFIGLKTIWNSWKMLVAALALALVFGIVSVARINFGTLPPALRSLWFVPHLIVYMLAYAIMALSVITCIASMFSKRIPKHLSGKLLSTASSLLLIGMICGAVWAKQAWGDYWTWDAKECWAAATWLLTLAGTHIPKKIAAFVFTIIAFLAIQMTWYGVNYLPASSQSLHTYNQEASK